MEKFSLVLSGGAAFGFAHIGVLEELEKRNLYPEEVIGTSFGAFVGACFAFGYSPREIDEIIEKFHVKNIRIFNFGGLISAFSYKKTKKSLEQIFKNKKISQTKIPLKIIATTLNDNTVKCFSDKDDILISDAVLASCAIPWAYKAVEINGIKYIDGYFTSNLGIEFANYKKMIAVDVLAKKTLSFFNVKKKLKIYERAFFIMQKKFREEKVKNLSHKNLILIEPELINNFSFLKFKKGKEKIILNGREEAKKVLDFI